MRQRGIDCFENSRRATLAQRAYPIANPNRYPNYSADEWGLTASDGPGGYLARGAPPPMHDDGTLAPTAPAGSIVFTPEPSVLALRTMYRCYRNRLWGLYGFRDAYNVHRNWFATDYLSIDQGPIVLMIKNFRTEGIWRRMMTHEAVVQGLQRAGFQSVSTAVAHALPAHKKGLECFPNPFTQRLVLQYITAKDIPVQVQVYDVLGRTVATYSGVLQQVGSPDQFALDATVDLPGRLWCTCMEKASRRVVLCFTELLSSVRPMWYKYFTLLVLWLGSLTAAQAQLLERAREDSLIEALLAQMTLEEKLGQLTLYNGGMAETGPVAMEGEPDAVRRGRVGAIMNFWGAEAVCAMQRQAVEESRLGIPLLFALDVIHGFRTIFPVPLAEAATFDPTLVEQTARAAAIEASAVGLNWTFAPMVDIARDARWGRIVEGSGEDPYLGALMAAARVRGFQGQDLRDPSTILATPKHFAAYGAAEGGRDYNTVEVSERTLREVYLPPFEAAVQAGALSVMAAFNEIGGVPASAHPWLLTEVLRGEWGFEGFVVSDWTSVWELLFHGIAADSVEAGSKALMAGVDMDMVSGIYARKLAEAVRAGQLAEAVVDEAVRRVLRVKYRLGLFEDPYRYCRDPQREQLLLAPAHRQLAREVAPKAIVLLKNEGELLPLADTLRRVAVIGALANDSASVLGPWAATGRPGEAVTILQGIRAALPQAMVRYAPGYPETPPGGFSEIVAAALSRDTSGFARAVEVARWAEVVILVLGEHRELSGEAASRTAIELPGAQEALARRILELGKPVVVVLMNGRPLAIPYLAEAAPALLETWFLGTEMGHAVADVLFGRAHPGGRLPVSFPRATGQEPLYYNHKPTGRPPRAEEKYTSKYLDVPWDPLYPFGYGLTYTTFAYDHLHLSRTRLGLHDTLEVMVAVTNTGRRPGEEVVQLYVRDEVASVTRPVKELKGFQRVALSPGETKVVRFRLPVQALRFWGMEGRWVVEPGWFTLWVGRSSAEGLSARFEVVAKDTTY